MVYISNPTDSCVKIQEGEWYMIMPKGSLIAISDESDYISLKVQASRKTIYGFSHDNCNQAQATAKATVEKLNSMF